MNTKTARHTSEIPLSKQAPGTGYESMATLTSCLSLPHPPHGSLLETGLDL